MYASISPRGSAAKPEMSFNYHMIYNEQTNVKNEQQNLSHLKVNICRQLYESGMSGPKIEAAMRSFGFEDFSCRILYRRTKGRGTREGWIREFGWERAGIAGAPACKAGSSGLTEHSIAQLEQSPRTSASRSGTPAGEGACVPVAESGPTGEEPPGFPDFVNWLKDISPNMNWDWKFQQVIYDALERITSGKIKRLMINIPPRHGKSELVTVRYLAWRLLQKPETNIILASYGQSLANRFSRKIRQVISDHVAMERVSELLSWTGGVAAASADGVVDELAAPRNSHMNESRLQQTRTIPADLNHPDPQSRATPPVQEGDPGAHARGTGDSSRSPVRFRCSACRAAAAAKREEKVDSVRLDHNDRSRCTASEVGDIDHCSSCGERIELESELPSWTGGVAAGSGRQGPASAKAAADGVVEASRTGEDNLATSNINSNIAIPHLLNHPDPQSRVTPPVQEGNQETLPSWTGGVAAASADGVVEASRTGEDNLATSNINSHIAILHLLNHPGPQSRATPPVQEGSLPLKMFPFTSSKPINTVSEWGTAAGGGLKAVGVGAGVTGFGADLIMVDDPVKNRAQAESETFRNRLWDWYTDDLYTRLEPNGAIVLIQTRWHEDDLAGRLIKQMNEGGEKWEIINLPAIKELGSGGMEELGSGGMEELGSGGMEESWSDGIGKPSDAGNAAALGCNAGSPGVPEPGIIQPEQSPRTSASRNGTPAGEGACVPVAKPRVIGYPRLYSRLNDNVAPLQGAENIAIIPEVPPKRPHPRLLSSSPSATPENPTSKTSKTSENSTTSETPATSATSATSETLATPQDWRVVGEALCPPRYDVPKLLELKDQLGTYSFSALYQQRPNPAEGSIFKREWLKNIVDKAPPGLKWFRGYDLAISTKTTADYTASFRVAIDEMGVMYIADGFRKRIEYPEQRRYVFERIMQERDTQHGIENSGNAAAIVSELRRQQILMRWPFRLVPVTADKTTRALTWSPRAEEGKLKLVRGPWIDEFVEELIRFPVGQHDDQVDAVSVAVAMMGSGEDRRLYVF